MRISDGQFISNSEDQMKIVEVSKIVTEQIQFEQCSLRKYLGKPYSEKCPNDCWVQVTGKPGKKTNHWGRNACRAKSNRIREATK